jgi:hypothetical protein
MQTFRQSFTMLACCAAVAVAKPTATSASVRFVRFCVHG